MNVMCCQLNIIWEDKLANHEKVRRLLLSSAVKPGTLVLLPEMFATGFSMNVSAIAESSERASIKFLSELALQLKIYLMGGVVSKDSSGKGRNEAVVFGPAGQEVVRYCKLHPFSFAGETQHFVSGTNVAAFACEEFSVTPFICYDLRFPEAFRIAVRRGAQLFTVIANWPQARESHWLALLKARAIENQAYVAGVNRCGSDPSLAYSGRSVIFDPRGEVLAEAGSAECLIGAELDLNALLEYRQKFPALQDMKDELQA